MHCREKKENKAHTKTAPVYAVKNLSNSHTHTSKLHNPYCHNEGGGGQKMSVFVQAQGIKTVHVVDECPPTTRGLAVDEQMHVIF